MFKYLIISLQKWVVTCLDLVRDQYNECQIPELTWFSLVLSICTLHSNREKSKLQAFRNKLRIAVSEVVYEFDETEHLCSVVN